MLLNVNNLYAKILRNKKSVVSSAKRCKVNLAITCFIFILCFEVKQKGVRVGWNTFLSLNGFKFYRRFFDVIYLT